MDYIKKLLQALLDTLVPPGTIIMYGGSQVPDGYILIQNVKVYEDEFPRLYPVLAACAELEKGNDSGRAWVKMPNPDGRVPQFTTSGSLVWKLLEAALPNSNGSIINMLPQSDVSVIQGTGPFRQNYAVGGGSRYCPNTVVFEENNRDGISFNLNYSNSLYEGSEFQLNALQILACIRC